MHAHINLHRIHFLRVEGWDGLTTGIPQQSMIVQEQDRCNLTAAFKREYLVGKVVGSGSYATVRVGIHKAMNRKIAIKIYQKTKIEDHDKKKSLRREIQILSTIDHHNCVKIRDVVETNHHINIIMDYISGVSLNSYLQSQPQCRIKQTLSRKIITQLAEVLKYLHGKHISHRDIKLENIILDRQLTPQLIDFGFSTCIHPRKKVKLFCGTPSYMAPEIVQKKEYLGQPADIWALGVLLFVMMSGVFPFKGSTDNQLFQRITQGDYPTNEHIHSKHLVDLLKRMLAVSPEERITAADILKHPWIHPLLHSTFPKAKTNLNRMLAETSRQNIISQISIYKAKSNLNRRLIETVKQNLIHEIRLAKQSLSSHKINPILQQQIKSNHPLNSKQELFSKSSCKALDSLKLQFKRHQQKI